MSLQVGGQITENTANPSVMVNSGAVLALDNIDNTISGSGEIGSGTVDYQEGAIGSLALTNGPHATIDARGGTLTIDTGHTIINTGLLEATTGGTLVVDDAVTGTGSEAISDGGILEFLSSVDHTQTVTFKGAGTLYLAQPDSFKGEIAGISASDILDLAGFEASTTQVTATFNEQTNTTTLQVADESDDQSVNLTLAGDHHADNFAIASDGNNGTLLVLNQETPIVVTGAQSAGALAVNFAPAASEVIQLQGAVVSGSGGNGLDIQASDGTSSDQIVAELDRGSSIFVAGAGSDGIHFTSHNESTAARRAQSSSMPPPRSTDRGQTASASLPAAMATSRSAMKRIRRCPAINSESRRSKQQQHRKCGRQCRFECHHQLGVPFWNFGDQQRLRRYIGQNLCFRLYQFRKLRHRCRQ